ncbi:MAG: ATP-binding cassette domain-containing protein [Paludibacteraceae bacterium]|nr:ATP-binding cassette domain-containing protein [Paludibacteraceae bacterium]
MSLTVSHIVKSYGKQTVLRDVSFSIEDGEIVGFLGPNGAGKSTLMKILTGSLAADSGNAQVDCIDVSANPEEVRRRIGYLPEHNPLYLDMYVREYLQFTARMYRMDRVRQRVDEMVERIGLGPESHKRIGQLSKGYRQRVGLAQALIHEPRVLILDEPTTGLDPNQLVEIRQLIAEFGKDKTVLFSTHIMQEIPAICDRFLMLRKGELVADHAVDGIAAAELEQLFHELTH